MNTEIIKKIKDRITKVKQWKSEAMNGYIEHLGNYKMEYQTAALNLAYDMELSFLNEILTLIGN